MVPGYLMISGNLVNPGYFMITDYLEITIYLNKSGNLVNTSYSIITGYLKSACNLYIVCTLSLHFMILSILILKMNIKK